MEYPVPGLRVIYLTYYQSDRSRGFGFIRMSTVEEAGKCIAELNGIVRVSVHFLRNFALTRLLSQDLNGRRIRVDYSVTDRPHAPTPGEYMGHRRSSHRDSYYGGRDSRDYREGRDYRPDHRDGRDRDRGRGFSGGYDKDRDRDPYGRDSRDRGDRDWRRSPPPRRHSPDYRRRRSHSRTPPRASSPARPARDYDGPTDSSRW